MLAKPVGKTDNGAGGGAEDYILIRDEKPSGTHGGTFTLGAWQTRTLNTEVEDTGGHASLAANQITLAAGTYRVRAHCPAYLVNKHKCKLYNVTDASDIIIGTSELTATTDNGYSRSFLEGRFTIAAPKVIELQHRGIVTKTTTGFGVGINILVIEVYSVVEFWKEA
jgi:hypothetical protein